TKPVATWPPGSTGQASKKPSLRPVQYPVTPSLSVMMNSVLYSTGNPPCLPAPNIFPDHAAKTPGMSPDSVPPVKKIAKTRLNANQPVPQPAQKWTKNAVLGYGPNMIPTTNRKCCSVHAQSVHPEPGY